MGDVSTQSHGDGLVAWAVAEAARPDEPVSGDLHVVQPFSNGVLIGVVDGVGHGSAAAAAARIVASTLSAFAHEAPIDLMLRCHEGLRSTRGAVMTIASLDHRRRTVSWLGVGNVEGVVVRAGSGVAPTLERVLLRGGIVGHQLPPLRASVFPVTKGDLLLMATDGIKPEFADDSAIDGDPRQIVERILARHRKGTDDALVIAARYLGGKAREESGA